MTYKETDEQSSNKFKESRSDEVSYIIERMPINFGWAISSIILLLLIILAYFGFAGRYPDVVSGRITINSDVTNVKLVAHANGNLKFIKPYSSKEIKKGEAIAYIENSTTPEKVDMVMTALLGIDPLVTDIKRIKNQFPQNYSLGELNSKYYSFINALNQFSNHITDGAYNQNKKNTEIILNEQKKAVNNAEDQISIAKKNLAYALKFYKRDSMLYAKRVISESEFDQTQINFLAAKDRLSQASASLMQVKQMSQKSIQQLDQTEIEDPEKERELRINLLGEYNNLIDNIKVWTQKYVFVAPFSGKLQPLLFLNEDQFIESGIEVFSVIPKANLPYGQLSLPAAGVGKVALGQVVVLKLDNYPYLEYGIIHGKVTNISQVSKTQKTEDGEIEVYLVRVDFPLGLKTKYGDQLDFKFGMKGVAEIITNDRSIFARIFENIRYTLK